MTKEEFNTIDSFGVGAPNTAFAKYFIGNSYLKPLTNFQNGEFPLFNVSFEPGCRNNWHIHHVGSDGGSRETASDAAVSASLGRAPSRPQGGGQILICTAGSGWYQEWGKDPVSLEPGKVIVIPANVKHWHGAKKDSWFSHITFEPSGENTSNEWLEPVTDEVYNAL